MLSSTNLPLLTLSFLSVTKDLLKGKAPNVDANAIHSAVVCAREDQHLKSALVKLFAHADVFSLTFDPKVP